MGYIETSYFGVLNDIKLQELSQELQKKTITYLKYILAKVISA